MKIVLSTCSKEEKERLAKTLLENKLCACISMIDIKSMYWWKNKIEDSEETLLIIKTKDELVDKLIQELKEIHSYETPEIVVLPVERANEKYLKWIEEVTK